MRRKIERIKASMGYHSRLRNLLLRTPIGLYLKTQNRAIMSNVIIVQDGLAMVS